MLLSLLSYATKFYNAQIELVHQFPALNMTICDRIWEKGALRANPEFWFQNAYNFEAVIATDPPTSGMGVASAHTTHGSKSPVYTSLWQLTARDRRHAVAFNVGSVK